METHEKPSSPRPGSAAPARKTTFGPLLIAGTFALLAFSTFVILRRVPALLHGTATAPEGELQVLTPELIELMQARPKSVVPPLEPSPGPPVTTPPLPEATASKSELWRYGQTYLGWQDVADVDLERFTNEELHDFLAKDQRLYGQAATAEAEGRELSSLDHQD